MRVYGLGGGIDQNSSLGHRVDQSANVVADIRRRRNALISTPTISSSERSPSHSPSTAAAVGLRRTAPSGTSSRCSSRTSS